MDDRICTLAHGPASSRRQGALGFAGPTWSPDDLLLAAHDGATLLEAYAWTDDGRLAARYDTTGLTETFSYDGAQLIAASPPSGPPSWQAVWGGGVDELVEFERQENGSLVSYVPLTDQRHAVVGLWRSSPGELAQILDYDDHGRLTVRDEREQVVCAESGESAPCAAQALLPFQFSSAWRSSATGLVLMRHRWYAPRLAQFVSADPLLFVDGYDVWAFAAFDPINRWDRWGLGSEGTADTSMPGRRRGSFADGWADFGIDAFIRPTERWLEEWKTPRGAIKKTASVFPPNRWMNSGLELGRSVRRRHANGEGYLDALATEACDGHPGCFVLHAGGDLYSSVEDDDEYMTGYNGARFASGVANALSIVVLSGSVGGAAAGAEGAGAVKSWTDFLPQAEKRTAAIKTQFPNSDGVVAMARDVESKVHDTRPLNLTPPGAGRRGAFRAAKRNSGVPMNQHPESVAHNLDRRDKIQPGRVYTYKLRGPDGKIRKIIIREDAGGHDFGPGDPHNRGPHFNDPDGGHYDY